MKYACIVRKTQLWIYFWAFLQISDIKPYIGEGDAEEQEKINHSVEQTWGVKHAGGGSAACYGRGEVNIFGKLKRNVSFLIHISLHKFIPVIKGGKKKLPPAWRSKSQGSARTGKSSYFQS